MLQRGCRWRIASGKSVGIWGSNWLPRQQAPQVLSPICETLAEAKIELLIDSEPREWNHSMVEGIFIQEEVELIKNLPLPSVACEDNLFWPFTHNGVYNSKSGYQFLKAEEAPNEVTIQVDSDKALWKGVWSLQIPNKMRNLLWRACRNSLPTKQNLVHRTIIDNPLCNRCKGELETPLHALWSCSELDVVWEDESLWACRGTTTFMDFKELLSWMISAQQNTEMFSVTVWTIRTQQNQVRTNHPYCSPNQLANMAKELLSEFQAVQQPSPPQSTLIRVHWRAPILDMVKVNFDGALFSREQKSGIGVVIRDA